jgi:uncharacterized membrane protein YfcA
VYRKVTKLLSPADREYFYQPLSVALNYLSFLTFLSACLAIGCVSGFLGGLLGIGGGVVIVPALIILFDLAGLFGSQEATVVAVATSLSCIVFTSLSAAITQARADMVDWQIVRNWVIFLVFGSFIAGSLADNLPTALFRSLIGGFLLFVAFVMLASWRPSATRTRPGKVLSAILGSVGGLVAGIAGIAGGNVIVPTLIYFNTPIHRATATSSTLGVPIALAGALGYITSGWNSGVGATTESNGWMLGYLYLPAFLGIICTTVLTAPLGVKAAHRIDALKLRRAFGLLLIVVALRMLYSALMF